MAKKELTKMEQNDKVWAEIKKLEDKIADLKETLHPAELPKQASLHECNKMAAKIKEEIFPADPYKLAEEAPKIKGKK